jgi:hypothetical protein
MKFSPDWEDVPGPVYSDEQRYTDWIKTHYPTVESAVAKCAEATLEMARCFPELRRVSGLLCHGDYKEDLDHWWLVTETGEIVDPTQHQYNQMFILGYYEVTKDSPIHNTPRSKCPNCGDSFYGGGYLCSTRCEREYSAYLNG